jgi:hypothetical protein
MLSANFVGLRYFHQSYPVVTHFLLILLGLLRILIRYKCGQNSCLQKKLALTYHFHNRALIAGVEEIQGMGDASLIATYSVYETQKTALFLHTVQIELD